jgi:hypothetical protein
LRRKVNLRQERRVRDIDKALADISAIRGQIASHTAFRGYGPVAITITGLLALGMATAQALFPIAGTPLLYGFEWLATAIVCGAVVRIEMQGRSQRLHSGLADTMIHQAIEQFLPATAASLFMPLLLLQFAPESTWMMPGLWQLFVSLGIYASLHNLPRAMFYAGAFYLISGFVSLLYASQTHALSPWLMGVPFFVGQSMMAMILYFAAGENDGED